MLCSREWYGPLRTRTHVFSFTLIEAETECKEFAGNEDTCLFRKGSELLVGMLPCVMAGELMEGATGAIFSASIGSCRSATSWRNKDKHCNLTTFTRELKTSSCSKITIMHVPGSFASLFRFYSILLLCFCYLEGEGPGNSCNNKIEINGKSGFLLLLYVSFLPCLIFIFK